MVCPNEFQIFLLRSIQRRVVLVKFMIGETMYDWAIDLYPINRSITGEGVRNTLSYIKCLLPNLTIHSVPSGTEVFDWIVPDEWTIHDAYIADASGCRIVDFRKNNLHVVGYSEPVDVWLSRDELEKYLYSLPDQPDAIPYVTSYYKRRWGFCLTHNDRSQLPSGQYHVVIDSEIKPGNLNYGELILPGIEEKEILLSTYICHPSMANNETSGPVVTTAIARWLQNLGERRYTYRIIFIPETIGSITYLSMHAKKMMLKTVAGFVITCVGDDRAYSYLPSRRGDTLADKVAKHILNHKVVKYREYSFLQRGSDERQYCHPLIDLPVVSVMRSKYGEYPEYHTSLDDLSMISPQGLMGAYHVLLECIHALEKNYHYKTTLPCEPQLGKRGLYPTLSIKNGNFQVKTMMDFLAYADGNNDLIDISQIIDVPIWELYPIVEKLIEAELIKAVDKI